MKKLFKILSLVLLVAVSAFSMVACGGGNDTGDKGILCKKFTGEDFYTVYGYVDDGKGVTSLNIEQAVREKTGVSDAVVGRINKDSFAGNNTLTEIIVPNTIEDKMEICQGAFAKMKKLQKITVPFVGRFKKADAYLYETQDATDKAVDFARTFGYIFGTEEYEFGTQITANYGAGTQAFYMPASLYQVKIAAKENYKVPMYAFCGVSQINKVELINVIEIGEYAFSKANSIKTIEIPNTVTKIHNSAFVDCVNLKSVTFAGTSALTTIGEKAFKGTGLDVVVLPESVVTISDQAFEESKITSITLPTRSDLNIGNFAFRNCKELVTMVNRPGSFTALGVIDGCDKLS